MVKFLVASIYAFSCIAMASENTCHEYRGVLGTEHFTNINIYLRQGWENDGVYHAGFIKNTKTKSIYIPSGSKVKILNIAKYKFKCSEFHSEHSETCWSSKTTVSVLSSGKVIKFSVLSAPVGEFGACTKPVKRVLNWVDKSL
ncbi:hypothetical protein [Shewanella piezotolerans]|uniref:hypothetical protein n=1 Tax=Shewanella piezotolerans TaxID=404011 RepID=UPI0005CB0967|nr:hypothetical protein [Shewanella piezotolerans]